jgi:N-acetylneuraminate epimerase
MMTWDVAKQDVIIKQLPSLPIPVSNACMSSIGKVIYLFGGESNGKPTDQCFMFNPATDKGKWQALPPMPIAMSHSVAVTQSNGNYPCIYIIGGRSSTPSGISVLHSCAWCFDPKYDKWIALSNVGDGTHTTTISAGTAVANGRSRILLIGGDKGNLFHQIENYNALIELAKNNNEKQRITREKLILLNNHPGFSKDVYMYSTLKNTWKKIGELPFYGQVTTTAIMWDNEIFIPCGEIKPGVRTPKVTMGKFDQ